MSEASEASSYPGTVDTWSLVTDKEDDVEQSDINKLKNAFTATQTELGTDPAGTATDLKTRLAVSIADSGVLRNGTGFPGSPSDAQPFYRTDEDTLYIYDGTTWEAISTTSNVIFNWKGKDNASQSASNGHGLYTGTGTTPDGNDSSIGNFFWIREVASGDAYEEIVPSFRWTKIAGVSTFTIFTRAWANSGAASSTLRFDAGGQTGESSTFTDTTPADQSSFTVDVSSLSNGTTYSCKMECKNANANVRIYISSLSIMGS